MTTAEVTSARREPENSPEKPQNGTNSLDNPNYTLRVICCVLFIFLTEICLAHYIYRLINSEMRESYVPKSEVDQYVINSLRYGLSKDEVRHIAKDLLRTEREDSSVPASRTKRSLNRLDQLSLGDDALVDFFHPDMKSKLQAKEEIERQKTGKGTAPGGDNWVWLTNYCRVTLAAIQGYCGEAIRYCKPNPGPKGEPGGRGNTGLPGIPGVQGIRGHPGHPGEKGTQGRAGLDGRDGVPGEPGLDGIPGRNGYDGIPGKDGTPGRDGMPGIPGRDGRNGTDGRSGAAGPQGPPGPQGIKGLTGPRGRSGKPGTHGNPGIPGINAWKTKVNGTSELLIPPSITGGQYGQPIGPAVIAEGDNVTLHCAATGVPKPQVEWIRTDGQPITMGAWQALTVAGHTINITLVSRVHMGTYQCVANNGVPPQVNQTFIIEVHFTPLVRIWRDEILASNGSTAVLACEVEAFPEALRYWERADGRLLENGDKYRIDNTIGRNGYTVRMQLNITRINHHDFSRYYCVAKNEKGITRGIFSVIEVKPGLATPPPIYDDNRVIETGKQPPERLSQENICPPPVACQECLDRKETKCRDSGVSLFDLIGKWEIRQYSDVLYHGFPNRTTDCVLYAVGKPVYHRFTNETYGSWMRDPMEREVERFYTTREHDFYRLFQFDNKAAFRKDAYSRYYNLTHAYKGNAHVVFNGSFYYSARDQTKIMKLDLESERLEGMEVPLMKNTFNYLYSSGRNYMDFSIDDNGLWVVFGVPDSNNTAVMKVDTTTPKLQIQYIWNISLNHHKVGEMFVVCGVLYAVDSVQDRDSRIRFALDLYKNTLLDVNLPFTNPFRNTTMVGYNYKHKELYTWDRGNQLTYPVRYHEIGYKQRDEPEPIETLEAAMQTGLQVFPRDEHEPY